jgi:hypothetical protein
MTVFDIAVIFFVVWFLFLRHIKIVRVDAPQPERGGEKLEEEYLNTLKPPIVCNTEFIGSQIYVWNKETNTFLIQGKTMEEIVEYFTKNHPGRKIILVEKKQQ